MPYFACIKHPSSHEMIVGLSQDLQQQGWASFNATFATIDDLFTYLQRFREQEWIITCVSDLPELSQRWKAKWKVTPPVALSAPPTRQENQA